VRKIRREELLIQVRHAGLAIQVRHLGLVSQVRHVELVLFVFQFQFADNVVDIAMIVVDRTLLTGRKQASQ
jgi:hypothetical protein